MKDGAPFLVTEYMLRGSLKALGAADALLEAAGIAGERRAETLSVAEFDRLARALLARSV